MVFALGIGIRLVLLPAEGLRDDTDQFVGWVHHIVVDGLGQLYRPNPAGPVSFGPVMAYVWAGLAAVDPALRTAIDASDPGVRMVMKAPSVLADLGIAAIVAYALRGRPVWAVVGAAAILFHPAVVYITAWWGQYESIYGVGILAAAVLSIRGRTNWAAVALTLALMTKPQVLPLLIPFGAWFWALGRWRGLLQTVAVGAVVMVIAWLPFIPAGGPGDYLANVGAYQNTTFAIASLRAWNVWWLIQEAAAGGAFVLDDTSLAGPITFRVAGFALAGFLEAIVAVAVIRDPKPRTFILGLAASALVAFAFLTQMHERYAYAAIVFLPLLILEVRARWIALALGAVFTLNLLAAVPPSPEIGDLLPISGVLGIAGSVVVLAITAATLLLVAGRAGDGAATGGLVALPGELAEPDRRAIR